MGVGDDGGLRVDELILSTSRTDNYFGLIRSVWWDDTVVPRSRVTGGVVVGTRLSSILWLGV